MKWLFLILFLIPSFAWAQQTTSTVNPMVPVNGQLITAPPIQQNFLHTYNDINTLFTDIGNISGGVNNPNVSNATGTLAYTHGGTGLTSIGFALQCVQVNSGGTGLTYGSCGTGSPGGSNGQIQFNNSGVFGGLAINYGNVTIIPQSGYKPEGDDITAPTDSGGATIRYVNPLASSLGTAVTVNYAVDGAQACDVVDQQTFVHENPGASGNPLYTIEVGLNDANHSGGVSNYLTNVFRPCMQAAMSWLSIPVTSKVLINNSTCTVAGTWGSNSPSGYVFSPILFSNTAGSTISCNITTTGGPIYFWYQLRDNFAGQATIQIDGGSLGSATITGDTTPAISTQNAGTHGLAVQRFTSIPAGSHTVLLTMLSGSGGFPYIVPFAVGTSPASVGTTGPRVFVSGVPFQQNDANSALTASYNTEVQNDVNLFAGDGLPVYFMDIRNVVNSTTNMASALFPNNSGQTNIANGFSSLITSTLPGITVDQAITSASGGLGVNASSSTGAVSFAGGAASVGTLTIGNGGSGSTTNQGALNNFFVSGTSSSAPVAPPCTGNTSTGDQSVLSASFALSRTQQTYVVTPPNCYLNGQIVLGGNTYTGLFNWPHGWDDLDNADYGGDGFIFVNVPPLVTAPGSSLLDGQGQSSFTLNGVNIKGSSGGTGPFTLMSKSKDDPTSGPAAGTFSILNSLVGDVSVVMGAAGDDVGASLNVGGISQGGMTIGSNGAGYTPGKYYGVPFVTVGTSHGDGAMAYVVTIGTTGSVSGVQGVQGGEKYRVGDVVTLGTSKLGGTGSGFTETINSIFGTGALSAIAPNGTGQSFGTLTGGGTGYVTGVYTNGGNGIPLTGGSGTGAIANSITVNGSGVVSAISIKEGSGTGYYIGDVLSASNTFLGGSGSGLQFTVAGLLRASFQNYYLPHMINTVNGNIGRASITGQYTDLFAWMNDFTGGAGIYGNGNGLGAGAGADGQAALNRFEYSHGALLWGGFDIFSLNNFTGGEQYPWSLLIAGNGPGGSYTGDAFEESAYGNEDEYVEVGMGGVGNTTGVTMTGTLMGTRAHGNSVTNGCVNFDGATDDYWEIGGVCIDPAPAINFMSEHLPHAFYHVVGPQGVFAWLGMPAGVGTDTPLPVGTATLDIEGTSSVHIPVGNTTQRPAGPVEGLVRDNTTIHAVEAYVNGSWGTLLSGLSPGAGISSSVTGSQSVFAAGGSIYMDASYLPFYIGGLVASNDQTTPNTVIDTTAGAATSDDNLVMMKLPAFTKTTGSWAVGSGNGGLDTGSVANSTWYHVFVIERTDTGVVDELISASASFPVLPGNYTEKRYIYSFLTDGSAHIVAFKTSPDGDKFFWTASVLGFNDTGVTTSATLETMTGVPTGVKVHPLCRVAVSKDGNSVILTSPTEEADVAPSNANPITAAPGQDVTDTTIAAGTVNYSCPYLITNPAAQIRARSSASGTTVSTVIRGWEDLARHTAITQTIVLTSASVSPLILPLNWNPTSNQEWALGEGGNGGTSGTYHNPGGGSGALAEIVNLSDAAATSEAFTIGSGGTATKTQFKNSSTLVADFGITGGAGGLVANSVGAASRVAGCSGGADGGASSAGGGAGAPGPLGVCRAGAANSSTAGGGGGGSNGGSSTAGSVGGSSIGGNGGDGTYGFGHGVGTSGAGGSAIAGTGAGGAGGVGASGTGGNGSNDVTWGPSYGIGGGGGGGSQAHVGGSGGFGAGGGGKGAFGTAGTGGGGEIAIIWTIP